MSVTPARPAPPTLWLASAALSLAPLVAMRVTQEANWTAFDVAAAAALLGLSVEGATRLLHRPLPRRAAVAAAVAIVALIWAEGAIGIFG